MTDARIEDLLRELAPQVLGVLTRRYGRFDACEDATQEALLKAARRWPTDGIPENPGGWLQTVAYRVLVDELRRDGSRRRREEAAYASTPQSQALAGLHEAGQHDDSLELFFLCCHPSLSTPSQIALTLRAVGGLTTTQIAGAFLVPETTMAQRISRAKATIEAGGRRLEMPGRAAGERLSTVQHVLYLIFNEGYTATTGADLMVPSLSDEAIRLTRLLRRLLPADGETAGLLALMLLTDARRPARTRGDGSLVPLAEQDRSLWTSALIAEGLALISQVLPVGKVGPYQLQAAIAAVYVEAPTMDETDWPQILALYDLLERAAPNPMTTLNRAVAVAMVHGPAAGLDIVSSLETDGRLARSHRILATRAHLRQRAGDRDAAAADYRQAAALTASIPERRYLIGRAVALGTDGDG
ncbi:RNA polymerase sigma factor [Pseudofrankia inefficax]|uniref:Putative RNA polymerase, sigma-24 subunit, ECF subfamily n=1 Tax=Pseudofrankia inefficax (strain DSM 45817 / CECT 9037 / DDB 130130 / EuI1c) TaxID=298654 RepID=E3J8P8_PSEI1|nr:DUF6596 domain-containing protein [Pseudofrankia inefficax]ADP78491.1 putative RNA polymerase, sigma-24 subunit, ECF subfamily [Pseudofrankia inefficax]